MILFIDDSLVEEMVEPNRKKIVVESIIRAIQSQIDGNHFVFGEKATLIKLLKLVEMSSFQRATLKDIINNYSQSHFLTTFSSRVELVSGVNIHQIDQTEGGMRLRISCDIFLNSKIYETPILLSENSYDNIVYKFICSYSINQLKIYKKVKMECHTENGGGSSIALQLPQVLDQGFLSLCIVDSDCEYPEGLTGQTYNEVKRIYDEYFSKHNFSLVQLIKLDVREIENLFPLSVYKQIYWGKGFPEFFELLARLPYETRKHVDYKKGIDFSEVCKSNNSGYKKYWTNKLIEFSGCNLNKFSCKSKNCKRIAGFGNNILRNVTRDKGVLNDQLQMNITSSYEYKKEWMKLGEQLISWFCSPRISRRVY